MTSWKTYRYTEIADLIGGGTPKTSEPLYWDGDIPWLSVKDFVGDSKYVFSTEKHITKLGLDNSSTKLLQKDDIIISARGTVGEIAMIPSPMSFNQSCFGIRANGDLVDPHFLYYYTKTKVNELKGNSHGSVFDTITRATFDNIICSLPPLAEQRRIAGILSAIDDKIENNRRINANLELQAQALYKQWFVDNRSDDWEEKLLSEIAEFVGGYSYKGNELVESSSTAMATIKNFERKGGFKVEGFKDIVASSKLKAEQHAELFDILVAHTDLTQNADVIGNAEILLTFGGYTDIIFSMDLVKVLPKSNFPYKYLLAALLKNPYFKAHCLGYVNGTTVLHMSKKALPEYVVACPPNSEAERMDRAFKVYYHKMAEILQENETLASLRDTLLPKLMNGEIKL